MLKQMLPHKANWLILLLFLVLATIYSLVTPAWEAPDEVGHFAVIQHIRQTGMLPNVRQVAAGEAHQPPLYYLIVAVATLPIDLSSPIGAFQENPDFIWNRTGGTAVNAHLPTSANRFPFMGQARGLHLARLVSVLMGAATVVLVMGMGHHIFPKRPQVGLLAGSLVAFNPQFLFLSGAVNNDNLLILLVTGAVWQAMRVMKRPFAWQQWAFIGLWLSAVMLTKLTGIAIVLTIGLMLIMLSLKRRSWQILLRGGLSISLVMLIMAGWWFARNQLLYGDWLGYTVFQDIFAVNMRQAALQWVDLATFVSVQFRSFWGVFGWMNLPAPPWLFTAVTLLLLTSFLGLVLPFNQYLNKRKKLAFLTVYPRPIGKQLTVEQKQALLFLATAVLLQEGVIVGLLIRCSEVCYQGRYLLPGAGPLMIFVSLGLLAWIPVQRRKLVAKTAVFILTAVALFMPLQIIRPAYQQQTNIHLSADYADFSFSLRSQR